MPVGRKAFTNEIQSVNITIERVCASHFCPAESVHVQIKNKFPFKKKGGGSEGYLCLPGGGAIFVNFTA